MSDSVIDQDSESIIRDVVTKLGDLTGSQLVELTHRVGSPWQKVWDETHNKIIPDAIIKAHYIQIQQTGHTESL